MSTNTQLIPFQFDGNPMRVIKEEQGETYFVAKDVCNLLGYVNQSRDVQRHCKHAKLFKSTEMVLLDGASRGVLIIPESDLQRLTLASKMPHAERFRDWVCEELIPSVRKTGGYVYGEKLMSEEELVLATTEMLKKKVELLHAKLVEQQPKVDAYDLFLSSEGTDNLHDALVAIGLKPNLAMKYLLDKHVLYKHNKVNLPYQSFINRRYFEVITVTYDTPNGQTRRTSQCRVTPYGSQRLREWFKEQSQDAIKHLTTAKQHEWLGSVGK